MEREIFIVNMRPKHRLRNKAQPKSLPAIPQLDHDSGTTKALGEQSGTIAIHDDMDALGHESYRRHFLFGCSVGVVSFQSEIGWRGGGAGDEWEGPIAGGELDERSAGEGDVRKPLQAAHTRGSFAAELKRVRVGDIHRGEERCEAVHYVGHSFWRVGESDRDKGGNRLVVEPDDVCWDKRKSLVEKELKFNSTRGVQTPLALDAKTAERTVLSFYALIAFRRWPGRRRAEAPQPTTLPAAPLTRSEGRTRRGLLPGAPRPPLNPPQLPSARAVARNLVAEFGAVDVSGSEVQTSGRAVADVEMGLAAPTTSSAVPEWSATPIAPPELEGSDTSS
ncbi:hypothetical protein BDK51DRAFT_46062 [Blyttiomyces helicus]|uniref:Uncharacterized protein n=1 Tax=Blyttiomyces helicus TaxID=388810 RepID=A0A4P9WET5_9FUNG|nr:hypothetical protein BDK51DRAFT_46062 [Blyttiomyces helicus]|eukprot:RKO91124.1 hypothetical protein BDK51DRAFT_46062 [Blyttiomyces helicus]